MGFFKKRHDKIFEVYTVVHKDRPKHFLTITLTQKEAFEYAVKQLRVIKFDHFEQWCNLRNYDVEDDKAFEEYYINCIDLEEKNEYLICKVQYKHRDIVAALRTLGKCVPLGCSFDTPLELEIFFKDFSNFTKSIDKEE